MKKHTTKKAVIAVILSISMLGLFGCGKSDAKKAAENAADTLGIDNEEDIKELERVYEEIDDEMQSDNSSDNDDEVISAPMDKTKPLTGIIYMEAISNPDTTGCLDISIYNIDTETGKAEKVRLFKGVNEIELNNGKFWSRMIYQSLFSPDLTLVAKSKVMDDGSKHVGYEDQDENFTDISQMISQDLGDFGNTVCKHSSPVFSRDGKYFYFIDWGGRDSSGIVKRVPISDIRSETVEDIDATAHMDYLIDFDGTVKTAVMGTELYNFSGTTLACFGWTVCDWIDDVHALCENSNIGKIYNVDMEHYNILAQSRYSDDPDAWKYYDEFVNYDKEKDSILPEVDNRINLCPVLSPDKSKIAFLSYDNGSTDRNKEIFITDVNGETVPQKLDTDIVIQFRYSKSALIDWLDGSMPASETDILKKGRELAPGVYEQDLLDKALAYNNNIAEQKASRAVLEDFSDNCAIIQLYGDIVSSGETHKDITMDRYYVDVNTLIAEDDLGYQIDFSKEIPQQSPELAKAIKESKEYKALKVSEEELLEMAKQHYKKVTGKTPKIVKFDYIMEDEIGIYIDDGSAYTHYYVYPPSFMTKDDTGELFDLSEE